MRSDLNETAEIDQYLFNQLNEEETKVFKARLLINSALAEKVEQQRYAHLLIIRYSRKKELERMEEIFGQLLMEPAFAHHLTTIFH